MPRMSAALAFYTVFSLAPILIVVIAIAGLIFGQKMAFDQMLNQIQQLIGRQSAATVQAMMEALALSFSSLFATVVGVVTLLASATGAFVELQEGLNLVWKVKPAGSLVFLIKQRLTSVALMAGIVFLLLVSLVISAALSAVGTFLGRRFAAQTVLWHVADFGLSCGVITALFAMIFKTLPEVFIPWNDIWVGAAVTAVLFTFGKLVMGFYIAHVAPVALYGTASAFIAVLTWVYYSALVFYFGAEFTKAYADTYGSYAKHL